MTVILFFVFLCLGACVGSFLTMLTYRTPRKEDIIFARSHCPHCGAYLQPKSLIPIVSYFLQKGRCLSCGEKIGLRYPLIEIINTIAYIGIFLYCNSLINCIFLCLLFSVSLAITVVDLEHLEVPTYMQVALIFLAVLYSLINYDVDPLFAIFSGFIYFVVAEIARIIVEKLKKNNEVLGGADTKLIAICGDAVEELLSQKDTLVQEMTQKADTLSQVSTAINSLKVQFNMKDKADKKDNPFSTSASTEGSANESDFMNFVASYNTEIISENANSSINSTFLTVVSKANFSEEGEEKQEEKIEAEIKEQQEVDVMATEEARIEYKVEEDGKTSEEAKKEVKEEKGETEEIERQEKEDLKNSIMTTDAEKAELEKEEETK